MFGELVRRIAWLVPLSFVVSLAAFLAFPSGAGLGQARFPAETPEDRMQATFDGWPMLFNAGTSDVADRTKEVLDDFASGDAAREEHASRELVRLGGAAFPTLFEALPKRDAETQRKVGLALAPVAARMKLPRANEAADPVRTVRYWQDAWAARSIEFRPANVKTALSRLRRYRTGARLDEACELDTFVLPELFAELVQPRTEEDLELARAYVEVLARVTERGERISEEASLDEAREVVLRWQRFWWLYEPDYRTHDGASRATSALVDTRYAKWLTLETLEAPVQRPKLVETLARRASTTLAFVALSTLVVRALLTIAQRGVRLGAAPLLDHTRFVPALPLVPPVVLALGVSAVVERPNVWIAVATMALALALLPRPLAAPPSLADTLHRATSAAFGVDLILSAGGLASNVRTAIGDRDAAGLTITLVVWFLLSSAIALAVRVHEALPRVARWVAAAIVTLGAAVLLARPALPMAPSTVRIDWFAPSSHTLLSVVVSTAVGALAFVAVISRRAKVRGISPLIEFASLPAVLLGLLLALAGSRGAFGTVLGSSVLVGAMVVVHADRVRAAIHDTELYRASLALGSDPIAFAKRHLAPHARSSLGWLALVALGVTLGIQVGQRTLSAEPAATERLAIRIGLR